MAVGFPAKVSYVDGDVFSASDINDTNGTLNLLTSSTLSVAAGKNFLINGGLDIWQRGTSSTASNYGTADRWYGLIESGSGTWAQETTVVPTGATYSLKFTASATSSIYPIQAIESINATRLAGQRVTFSARVAASTSTAMSMIVSHSSSVNVAPAGSWTNLTAVSGGTATPTSTTFVPISGVYDIPSTAKSVRVLIRTTSTIASSVVVYWGNFQLELGSVATTFSRVGGTMQSELAACQRYYQKSFPQATAPAQNAGTTGALVFGQIAGAGAAQTLGAVRFASVMRASPTVTIFNPSAANAQIRNIDNGNDWSGTTLEDTADAGFGIRGTSNAASGSGNRAAFHYRAEIEL